MNRVPPNNFTDRLDAQAFPNTPIERQLPVTGLPVFSTITFRGVTTDFYDRIVAGLGVPQKLPAGWLVQVVFADGHNVYACNYWATLELGRDFFREKVAAVVAQEVATNPERDDVVREEFRSTRVLIGADAGRFAPEHFFDAPPSCTFVIDLRLQLDHAAGRTLHDAYSRIAEIVRSPEMQAELAGGLAVGTGGVTDAGGTFVFVHTDEAAGREFFDVKLPAMVAAAFSEWPSPTHSVGVYRTHRCIVAPELIAGA